MIASAVGLLPGALLYATGGIGVVDGTRSRHLPLDRGWAPLIRDSDDARAATGHYWAAAAYFDPPWRGAVPFSSDDGAVYVAADETQGAVAWGVAWTALRDTDLSFQTDTTSQPHLTMVSGSLASASNLEMLNGANLAALIRADGNAELIQFQDIALSLGSTRSPPSWRAPRHQVFTGATPRATCSSCSTVMV